MRYLPQQEHADLGLIDNDETEDLSAQKECPRTVRQHRRGPVEPPNR